MHEMKLQSEFFDYILNGSKRIELRLFDDKRKCIKLGDTIKFFREPDLVDFFDVKVIGLLNYDSFLNLINDFDIKVLASSSYDSSRLLDVLESFYSKEAQSKDGVLGIRFELI